MAKLNPLTPQYPPGAEPPRTVPGRTGKTRKTAGGARERLADAREQVSRKVLDRFLGPDDEPETDEPE